MLRIEALTAQVRSALGWPPPGSHCAPPRPAPLRALASAQSSPACPSLVRHSMGVERGWLLQGRRRERRGHCGDGGRGRGRPMSAAWSLWREQAFFGVAEQAPPLWDCPGSPISPSIAQSWVVECYGARGSVLPEGTLYTQTMRQGAIEREGRMLLCTVVPNPSPCKCHPNAPRPPRSVVSNLVGASVGTSHVPWKMVPPGAEFIVPMRYGFYCCVFGFGFCCASSRA